MAKSKLSVLSKKVAKEEWAPPPLPKTRKRVARESVAENTTCRRAKAELGITLIRKMNGVGNRSWPDRMFLIPGVKAPYSRSAVGRKSLPLWRRPARTVYIEFKKVGKEPTELQWDKINELREQGFDVEVFDDAEKAFAWLKSFCV